MSIASDVRLGYNYLYSHHGNIIRVNLDNQYYRDVTKTPLEDFDSYRDASSNEGAYLCDLFERASMQEEIERTNRLIEEEAYKSLPFHEIKIDEHCQI